MVDHHGAAGDQLGEVVAGAVALVIEEAGRPPDPYRFVEFVAPGGDLFGQGVGGEGGLAVLAGQDAGEGVDAALEGARRMKAGVRSP